MHKAIIAGDVERIKCLVGGGCQEDTSTASPDIHCGVMKNKP